jgi:hypothetical protein
MSAAAQSQRFVLPDGRFARTQIYKLTMSGSMAEQVQDILSEEDLDFDRAAAARPQEPSGEAPQPTFAADTPYGDGNSVQCFFPNCGKQYVSYYQLMNHVRNVHGTQPNTYKGSYFYTQFRAEDNRELKERRAKKRAAATRDSAATVNTGGDAMGNGDTAAEQVPKRTKHEPQADSVATAAEHTNAQCKWVKIACFVKATAEGEILSPIEYGGIAWPNQPEPAPPRQSCGASLQAAKVEPNAVQHQPSQSSTDGGTTPCELVPITEVVAGAPPPNAHTPEHPFGKILYELHDDMVERRDTTKWVRQLPVVSIKRSYMDCESPPAKGDGLCLRAEWPREKKGDGVEDKAFEKHMYRYLNKQLGNATALIAGAKRALGFLEVGNDVSPTDPMVMVSLFQSKNHMELLQSPLLSPRYYWTATTLSGLVNYALYHNRGILNASLQGAHMPFAGKHSECLLALVDDLKAGNLARCKEFKRQSIDRKLEVDRALLKKFPTVKVLQEAIRKAYMALRLVVDKTKEQGFTTKSQRGLMNQVMAGGYHFDTFGGRKWEVEHAYYTYMAKLIADKNECMVCRQHKTSKTYGDLAKLLTPGLMGALSCYNEAPRPEGRQHFFVPAMKNAEVCSFSKALQGFCKRFLPQEEVWPTNLLTRKYFHKKLMDLTKDERKLKQLMVILDAHSIKIQDRHYILRDPEDDIILAKVLVKQVLGTTVPWPTAVEAASTAESNPDLRAIVASTLVRTEDDGDEGGDEPDDGDASGDDPDDDCDGLSPALEWWHAAAKFGVPAPGELEIVPLADDAAAPDAAQPLVHLSSQPSGEPANSAQQPQPPPGQDAPKLQAKKSPFDPEERVWIYEECDKWGLKPHNERIRQMISEGEAQEKLKAGHTVDQVRNVCDQWKKSKNT